MTFARTSNLQSLLSEDLPLLDLFARLREAGLPLGVGEYQRLLRALQGGFGTTDEAALKRLCQTLWVKSPEDNLLFEYHFDRAIAQTQDRTSRVANFDGDSESLEPISTEQSSTTSTEISRSSIKGTTESSPTSETPVSTPEFVIETDDEMQVVRAVKAAENRQPDRPFLLTGDYFPVTRRQMKQSWRYLRRPVREGVPTELDVDATIDRIVRQGIAIEPVLVPRRVNRSQLLLLIDRDGSMVPFHGLSDRLAETAVRGGRLEKTGIYYFRNCPEDYLYRDRYHQDAVKISPLLSRLSDRTAISIISDAGAARGGNSLERIELTKAFLQRLKQYVRYIAWLNPVPQSRWWGTSAGEISRWVPMFEISRQGLQGAIDILRGR